ncbi:hypothetical protein CVT26_008467 [Gymnopilus dilepis]|uniref:DUF6534 domain-containing protein n=1 Tax=Gymnopilus dilepis TaxID=231916 RepID=A0A409XXG1_9AGAR|nr:hypothetical protein CVT26_008467 [Gymnopilus dilepis]
MESLAQQLDLNTTLGAAFVGNIVAGVYVASTQPFRTMMNLWDKLRLYGITCLQTYVYYRKGKGDHTSFKAIVSRHLPLSSHYTLLVFLSYHELREPCSVAIPDVVVSDLIVRVIYARRVWIISRSLVISLVITATSLVTAGTHAILTEVIFIDKTFANFSHISYLMYTSLGSAVAADILIAGSLCISLSKSRTGFKTPPHIVCFFSPQKFTLQSVNHDNRLCATACFITYAVWPDKFVFIGIYFCLSKLFFNSLLAMLNGRSSLKKKANTFSDIPVQLTQPSSTRPMEFGSGSTWVSKDTYSNQTDSEGLSQYLSKPTQSRTRFPWDSVILVTKLDWTKWTARDEIIETNAADSLRRQKL